MVMEDYSERQRVKMLMDVAMGISRYYLWPLFAVGFPGNVSAIVTVFRMKSIGTFPVFVVLLAVMDSLAILIKLLFYQLLNHQLDMGSFLCCLLRFLGSWSSAYSSWILVCMALERFVAVRFPLRAPLYNGCSAPKVLAVLAAVGFLLALIYMPQLWTNEINRANILQCQYKAQYASFMHTVFFWISACVYAFVPFCLLTVFNFLIARQIRSSLRSRTVVRTNLPLMPCNNHHQQHHQHHQHGGFEVDDVAKRQRQQRNIHAIQAQVNLMLLSATVVFIILTFPICIFMLADSYWHVQPGYTRSNAVKYLCQQLAYVLVDSTHAVNFYLYFLTARRFRHHFLRLVTCNSCDCSIKALCRQARGSNLHSEEEDL
ncbi:uncharacterized protein LOC143296963 isoform X2 [Babylonia areolata]|uniref:uncharacterized protein LOC143296963 isoform X2 n=1 Tax=Babylonia areolata TaxID=304850 RepID=UPI003FD172F1